VEDRDTSCHKESGGSPRTIAGSILSSIVFIVIDGTLLEKSGETMESVGYQYSPKDRKSILCHDLVSCIMVCSCGQIVPIDLRQYVKIRMATEEQREFKQDNS
jgi:hypothetical protein